MNFTLYIAKRYLFTKSSNNAINFITIIAAIGVIIGSASLLIVLSGFAGLKSYSLQFSSYVDPDLKVLPIEGKSFELTPEITLKIDEIEGIASYSKIIEERAVIETPSFHLVHGLLLNPIKLFLAGELQVICRSVLWISEKYLKFTRLNQEKDK